MTFSLSGQFRFLELLLGSRVLGAATGSGAGGWTDAGAGILELGELRVLELVQGLPSTP